MKRVKPAADPLEPLGIIISQGIRGDSVPLFRAYIWGPAPEGDKDRIEPQAA